MYPRLDRHTRLVDRVRLLRHLFMWHGPAVPARREWTDDDRRRMLGFVLASWDAAQTQEPYVVLDDERRMTWVVAPQNDALDHIVENHMDGERALLVTPLFGHAKARIAQYAASDDDEDALEDGEAAVLTEWGTSGEVIGVWSREQWRNVTRSQLLGLRGDYGPPPAKSQVADLWPMTPGELGNTTGEEDD